MKLKDILPAEATKALAIKQSTALKSKEALNQSLIGLLGQLQKSANGKVSGAIGVEQFGFDWVRTQFAYRRSMIQDMYLLAYSEAAVRTSIINIRNEVFRRGFEHWLPRFYEKCTKCGKEFARDVDRCDACDGEVRRPNAEEIGYFNDLRMNCNVFGQTLEDVLRECEDDVNIADDAFLLLGREYTVGENGETYGKVIEITRLHPALVEFDLDKDGLPGNEWAMCPVHRERRIKSVRMEELPRCPVCGARMKPTFYKYFHRNKYIFFFEEEVIHWSKFSPSKLFGYPPILSIYEKVLTLLGMDRFLYNYFFNRKLPAGMILTTTDDVESLQAERERLEVEMRANPDYVPWVAVSQKTGRGRTDFIRFFHTLQEMDYLPVRNELRERISAIYGVSNIWMGALEATGGISSQSQQLIVMSRVVESDQRIYNQKVIPQILEAFGIKDWTLRLAQPEERAESTRLSHMQQKAAIAQMMQGMGFDVALKPGEELDFQYGGTASKPGGMMGFSKGLSENWKQELSRLGHQVDEVIALNPQAGTILFKSDGNFILGHLGEDGDWQTTYFEATQPASLRVKRKLPKGLHQHGDYPPHPTNMPHDDLARRVPGEEAVWKEEDNNDEESDEG